MQDIKVRLTERITRTPTVESFRFLPDERINFVPGQFLKVILDESNKDNKDLNKYLSFSASSHREYIEVTKRLSPSVFSQRLRELKINDRVLLQVAFGACVFRDDYQKIGFLIGGIGITPVMSIIDYIVNKKLNTDVVLLYSNRTEDEIAFKPELDSWQGTNKNIKVFYTLTDCQPKDTTCIFGRIDKDLLIAKIKDYQERLFFIFGPPRMVEAMNALCLEAGCKKENIKTENFLGY